MKLILIRENDSSQITFGYVTTNEGGYVNADTVTYIQILRDIIRAYSEGAVDWQDHIEICDSKLCIIHNHRIAKEWSIIIYTKSQYYCENEPEKVEESELDILKSILKDIEKK